ncbi:MAG: hypothetical protein HYS18_11515 [Burkholderiales bacterium]|nr:hypothetical protein [Burkholderiales bacterium]
MQILQADRQQAISRLRASDEIVEFLYALDAPGRLADLFREPYYFYTQGYPENPGDWEAFRGRTLLPLWENGEQVFAADLTDGEPIYLAFYLEDSEHPEYFGNSVLIPLFHMLLLHVWEYGGEEQEIAEAMALAERLKLPRLELLRELLSDSKSTEDDAKRYRSVLI